MEIIDIPDKSSFKLNEVCGLTGVKPYILRFWENEFDEIAPLSSPSGEKFYDLKDIEAIVLTKDLLFDQKMTIEEVKYLLSSKLKEQEREQERKQTREKNLESKEEQDLDFLEKEKKNSLKTQDIFTSMNSDVEEKLFTVREILKEIIDYK